MTLLSIDGSPLSGLTSYEVKGADLDSENSSRSESGYLNRDRVRSRVYTISTTWKVSLGNLNRITSAISPVAVECTFFNPTAGGYTTAKMYTGNISGKLVYTEGTTPEESLWELSFDLIQY